MADHRQTILRWAAKGVPVRDIKAALKLYGVTPREVDDVIAAADRRQVRRAVSSSEFLEPPSFEGL